MRCDVQKLRAARERRAMTQEKLAYDARVDVRTIQRAEAGAPLRQETVADLAAALGLPVSGLVDRSQTDEVIELGSIFGPCLMLKRATSARQVIALLEGCQLALLECEADPTEETLPLLTSVAKLIERKIPRPWSETEHRVEFTSVVDRIETTAELNSALEALEKAGLALFYGSSWEKAVMPYNDGFHGMVTATNQRPELVQAGRLVIGPYIAERVQVQRRVRWPVELFYDDDLDDDVPF